MRRIAFYFCLGLLLGLAWMSTSAQIAVTGTGTASAIGSTAWPITAPNAGALRTGTTANDTLLLQAYDVDGAAYTTLLTLTAGTTPSMTGIFGPGSLASNSVGLGYANTGFLSGTIHAFQIVHAGAATYVIANTYFSSLSDTFEFTGGVASDVRLSREAAAVWQLGKDANGAAVAQTLKAHDGITGTDIAGANLLLAGGRGTGAGAPGTLIFQTATALASGTTAQTLATRAIIGATGALTVGSSAGTGAGALYAGSYFVGTTAGADCTSATAVTTVKGIVTVCSEPVPEPLTQSEVNELRGLLSVMRGKG